MKKRYTYGNRIKYRDLGDGKFISVKTYISSKSGAEYQIKIDQNDWTWKVINVNQRKIVKSGQTRNKDWIRKATKKALIQLGCEFVMKVKYYVEEE